MHSEKKPGETGVISAEEERGSLGYTSEGFAKFGPRRIDHHHLRFIKNLRSKHKARGNNPQSGKRLEEQIMKENRLWVFIHLWFNAVTYLRYMADVWRMDRDAPASNIKTKSKT